MKWMVLILVIFCIPTGCSSNREKNALGKFQNNPRVQFVAATIPGYALGTYGSAKTRGKSWLNPIQNGDPSLTWTLRATGQPDQFVIQSTNSPDFTYLGWQGGLVQNGPLQCKTMGPGGNISMNDQWTVAPNGVDANNQPLYLISCAGAPRFTLNYDGNYSVQGSEPVPVTAASEWYIILNH